MTGYFVTATGTDIGKTFVTAGLVRALRDLGRSICHAQARIGVDRANGNRAFAERMGYALANTEIERKLPLPPDLALLDRLANDANVDIGAKLAIEEYLYNAGAL